MLFRSSGPQSQRLHADLNLAGHYDACHSGPNKLTDSTPGIYGNHGDSGGPHFVDLTRPNIGVGPGCGGAGWAVAGIDQAHCGSGTVMTVAMDIVPYSDWINCITPLDPNAACNPALRLCAVSGPCVNDYDCCTAQGYYCVAGSCSGA